MDKNFTNAISALCEKHADFGLHLSECVEWENHLSVPDVSAVYFVFGRDGNLLYIGKTSSLRRRFKTHHRHNEFKNLDVVTRWVEAPANLMTTMEDQLIKTLAPKLNGTKGDLQDMARVGFEIKDSLRDLFKAAVAREGLQMSEVLREFINSYSLFPQESDASPSEIADLVTATGAAVAEMELTHGVFPSPNLAEVTEALRAALAPFRAVES